METFKERDLVFNKTSCHASREAAEKARRKKQDEGKKTRIKQDGERFCLFTDEKPKKAKVGAIVKNPSNLFDRPCGNGKYTTASNKGACSRNKGLANKKKK